MKNLLEIQDFLKKKKVTGTNFTISNSYLLYKVSFSPDVSCTLKSVEKIAGDFSLFVCAVGPATVEAVFEEGRIDIIWVSDTIKSTELPRKIYKNCVPLGLLASGHHRNIALANAPHIMVAGSSGSGKSYWMHAAIQTALNHDSHVFGLDPKWSEFAAYSDKTNFYHMREVDQIMGAMNLLLTTMDERFALLYEKDFKNQIDYVEAGNDMKTIVVFIDELADLVMTAGEPFSAALLRLAQKGRAAGIHLVCATQAPTAKLLSGELKANFPVKIAFKCSSAVASRVVLGVAGAEKLAGSGDGICITEKGEMLRFRGYLLPESESIDAMDAKRLSMVQRFRKRLKKALS